LYANTALEGLLQHDHEKGTPVFGKDHA